MECLNSQTFQRGCYTWAGMYNVVHNKVYNAVHNAMHNASMQEQLDKHCCSYMLVINQSLTVRQSSAMFEVW